jgi:hypothetical protein
VTSFGADTKRSIVRVGEIAINDQEARGGKDGQKIFEMISYFVLELEPFMTFN